MRLRVMTLRAMGVLAAGLLVAQTHGQDAPALKTEKDKQNYASGVYVVRNFKRQGVEIDLDLVVKGMKDAFSGGQLLMNERELRTVMNTFQLEMRKKQVQVSRIAALDNRREGEAFLTENKTKEGVVVLPNGLQYKVLNAGEGKLPTDTDTVECRYRATLLDGTEFDSTDPAGPPASLKISAPEVVPGLREALKLMPVGSKWQIFIPSPLAYGARGAGADVGPNATVIYEVELVGIK